MHSPGNCCSRSTLRIMERDPLTYTAIPPPLPLGRSLLKILYPGRDISPSAIPLSSHVSVKARICKFGHCDIRIFNSSSFPRILRIFWWINFRPRSLIASWSSVAILKSVHSTPLSPPESIPLTEHKKHFLLVSKSTPKHLRWYDWRQSKQSALPWFFLIVLWQLKHWIRTGPGFWRTSPQRSTKFTKSTSRVRRRIWRLWRWLPSFVMTGLLLRNEVEGWVVSMDKDFATNSSETSDRMYPSRLSTFFRVRLPIITSRNREIADFRQSFKTPTMTPWRGV